MEKFRMICPECRTIIVVGEPEAVLWEQCPSCARHVWDRYDVMMADALPPERSGRPLRAMHPAN